MPGLRRHMSGHDVVERVRAEPRQRSNGGGADEAVEQHRNAPVSRRQRRTEQGGEFAPAQRSSDPQGIIQNADMACERRVDRGAFPGEALIVDPGAAACPAGAAAAEQRRRKRSRRRRVADAHLAQADKVGGLRHRVIAKGDRGEELAVAHCRRRREIGGRLFKLDRDDTQLGLRASASWLMAAPPAAKFATIWAVTAAG